MPIIPDNNAPAGFIDPDLPPVSQGEETWLSVYAMSAREINEIKFAKLYVDQFDHGTDGHGRLHLIEHMNSILESMFEANTQLLSENEHFRDLLSASSDNMELDNMSMRSEITALNEEIASSTATLETLQQTMPQVSE